jgi:hypothetical protein
MTSAVLSCAPTGGASVLSAAVESGRVAFLKLEEWLLSEAVLCKPIHEVEREQSERGREVMRLLLQAHIDARGRGDVGAAVAVGGGDNVTFLSHRRGADRDLRTVFGVVDVKRLAYSVTGSQRAF